MCRSPSRTVPYRRPARSSRNRTPPPGPIDQLAGPPVDLQQVRPRPDPVAQLGEHLSDEPPGRSGRLDLVLAEHLDHSPLLRDIPRYNNPGITIRTMVRVPLTPDEIRRGRDLGAMLRRARGERTLLDVAGRAGISPETLRKIETGRIPTPSFTTVALLASEVGLSLDGIWRGLDDHR